MSFADARTSRATDAKAMCVTLSMNSLSVLTEELPGRHRHRTEQGKVGDKQRLTITLIIVTAVGKTADPKEYYII